MKKNLCLVLAVLSLVVVSCTPAQPPLPTVTPTPTRIAKTGKPGTIKTCEVPIDSIVMVEYGTHLLKINSYLEPFSNQWGAMIAYQTGEDVLEDTTLNAGDFFDPPASFEGATVAVKPGRVLKVTYPAEGSCEVVAQADLVASLDSEEVIDNTPVAENTEHCLVPTNFQGRVGFNDTSGVYHEVLFVSYDNNRTDRGVMIYYQLGNSRDFDSSHEPEKFLATERVYSGIGISIAEGEGFYMKYPKSGTCLVERSH